MALEPILKEAKEKLIKIANSHSLGAETPNVTVGILPVQQAIDEPNRQDFPPVQGKEVTIKTRFQGGLARCLPISLSGLIINPRVFSGPNGSKPAFYRL